MKIERVEAFDKSVHVLVIHGTIQPLDDQSRIQVDFGTHGDFLHVVARYSTHRWRGRPILC